MDISQAVRTSIYNAISSISVGEKAYLHSANVTVNSGYSIANYKGDLIAVSGIFEQGISEVIPVFDGMVNPNVNIPIIEKAQVYIIMQDQQESAAPLQTMCSERISTNITVRIVTKYTTANVTDRTLVEAIANQVKKAIRSNRVHNLESEFIAIHDVAYPIVRDFDEFASGQSSLSKALIYSITVNN